MEYLLTSLNTSRQSLLPQIKILEENHLVEHYEDSYELTAIGKIIVDKAIPLLSTLEVFDSDIDFWGTRILGFIPDHILEGIYKLRECEIINPPLCQLFDFDKKFQEGSKISGAVYIITSFLHPNFPELTTELIENNVNMFFIVSNSLLEKLLSERYTEFSKLFQNELVHIYVYQKEMDFHFFSVNDHYIMLNLLMKDGNIDNKYVFCHGRKALEWGHDYFEYCLEYSTPLKKLEP